MKELNIMTQSALHLTKEVTTRWTSRLAGSQACLDCGEYLKEQMSTFCDSVKLHEFDVRPGAFLGYIRINVVLYFIALAALLAKWFAIATALGSLAVLITILEFFVYWEFVDFLFPKKTGRNVVGRIEPSGEVKQQVIVSAHHDSAHIFHFISDQPEKYTRRVMLPTLLIFILPLISIFLLILNWIGILWIPLYWFFLAILTVGAYWVFQIWFFYDPQNGTPGAGDNLVCTALAMEIGKHFAAQKTEGIGLKHTRVVVASWDAEEAGLRGARAYAKAHKKELLDIKTYNYNLECMYDHNYMGFLTSDLNSFVKLSKPMAEEFVDVSKSLGYKIDMYEFPIMAGGTDSAELAKIGVESICLSAMNWAVKDEHTVYHTVRDTVDAVDPVAVERSIEIGIEYIKRMDGEKSSVD